MIAESYDLVTDSPTKRIYQAVQKIPKGMVVHHIDGNSLNNDKNNFALMTRASHTKWHSTHRRKAGDVSETSSK